MHTDIRVQRVQGFDLGLFLGLYFRIIINLLVSFFAFRNVNA